MTLTKCDACTGVQVRVIRIPQQLTVWSFLGAFVKLRKTTITFFMSVRLSAWNNSAPTGRICIKYYIWVFFEKSENSRFIKIGQEYAVLCMETTGSVWSYLGQFFLEWQIFHTKPVEKIRRNILFSVSSFENVTVYGIMWKNIDDNMVHKHWMLDA